MRMIPNLSDINFEVLAKDAELYSLIAGPETEKAKQYEYLGDRVLSMIVVDMLMETEQLKTVFALVGQTEARVNNEFLARLYHISGLGRIFIDVNAPILSKNYADTVERIIGLAHYRFGLNTSKRIVKAMLKSMDDFTAQVGEQAVVVTEIKKQEATEDLYEGEWQAGILKHSKEGMPGGHWHAYGQAKTYGIGLKLCARHGVTNQHEDVEVVIRSGVVTRVRPVVRPSVDVTV